MKLGSGARSACSLAPQGSSLRFKFNLGLCPILLPFDTGVELLDWIYHLTVQICKGGKWLATWWWTVEPASLLFTLQRHQHMKMLNQASNLGL